MSIESISIRRMVTVNYGFFDIPYVEITETLAQVSADLPYYIPINGKTFHGSIPSLVVYQTPDPSLVYTPIVDDTQAFEQYDDIKFDVAGDGDIYIIKNQDTDLRINISFWGDAQTQNAKIAVLIKTSDDKYVWGESIITSFSAGDLIFPDSTRFGTYGITGGESSHIAITNNRISNKAQAYIAELMAISVDASEDPYGLAGYSGVGGGHGTFSGTGDAISIPSLPTLGAVSTGFITLFNPTAGELASLASYMWNTSLFDLDTWQKLWADPMDAILGLAIVPVNVPSGGSSVVKVGNISTSVSMTRASAQYVEVDCGSLSVEEYWGAYLDYDPYTKAEIYLPYIGTRPLSVDDIMGKTVKVVYHIDILSGACCAFVKCGSSVLYTFIGQCSSSIPISGTDFTSVINGVLSAGVSVGSMVATGGATAPMAIPSLASTAVNSMKPSVEKSGAMAGTGGMMGVQTPYLILTRPRQALPENQKTFTGYPSFITRKMGDLSGYTEVESLHLENIPATEMELNEIENLLRGGVIF